MVITVEPPQEGERRVVVRRPGTFGLINIGWTRPGVMHPDFLALMLLDGILSEGVNSRLYKALVDTGIATDVDANAALTFALNSPATASAWSGWPATPRTGGGSRASCARSPG